MRVFVINLAKNHQRLNVISQKLDELGIAFERFDAIYGVALSDEMITRKVDRLHWWAIKGYLPRRGEIGAALSHLGIYRKMMLDGDEVCCVFEDDITPDERLGMQLQTVLRWIDVTRPQVVLLSNYSKMSSETWEIKPSNGDSSAEAYVLTRNAAEILLRHNTPVCAPSDYWIYWKKKGIELYHAFPTVVHPEWIGNVNYVSDVTPDSSLVCDVRHMNLFLRLVWKINRICGKVFGRIFYRD